MGGNTGWEASHGISNLGHNYAMDEANEYRCCTLTYTGRSEHHAWQCIVFLTRWCWHAEGMAVQDMPLSSQDLTSTAGQRQNGGPSPQVQLYTPIDSCPVLMPTVQKACIEPWEAAQ